MHKAVNDFIRHVKKETGSKYGRRSYFRFKKILEVGSKNINGSVRKHFFWCDYIGIDLSKGIGVDNVCDITSESLTYHLNYTPNRPVFDVVISSEMLEHCDKWEVALKNMLMLLKPGGLILITCAAPDRPEHGTTRTSPKDSPDTNDYYRNISTEDFRSVLPPELFSHYVLMYGRGMNDLYFYGIKK